MGKKGKSLQINSCSQNSNSSVTMEGSLDYKYLKTLNIELSKEIAELRKEQTRKQSDIDYLLHEKFDIELKYNQLYHLVLTIDERSRTTLNHIVECSNELAQIMRTTNKIKFLSSRLSDTSTVTTPSKNKENSFKQVVTPHAVNGHVIHTPTVRIARYVEPTAENRPNFSGNNEIGQNFEDDNLSSEEVVNENVDESRNEEAPGNRTFGSQSTISSIMNYDLCDLEEDPDEISHESPPLETNKKLSVIQEELNESGDPQEMEQPKFSNGYQEVNYKKIGSNNSTSDLSDSSVVPEASTSYNVTATFNDFDSLDENTLVKRKSFIEKKFIGSPIPSEVSRRSSNHKRRSSRRNSFSTDSKSTTRTSKDIRRSITSPQAVTSGELESTLTNCSPKTSPRINDTTVYECSKSDTAGSSSMFIPTIKTFIEKTSIHSTPSIDFTNNSTKSLSDSTVSVVNNVNVRKNRFNKISANPVVFLTRLDDLSEGDTEHIGAHSKKSSNDRKRNREEQVGHDTPIKKEKNAKKIKTESKSSSPKQSSLPDQNTQRPRRAAKPTSLKEPSILKKLRRSR